MENGYKKKIIVAHPFQQHSFKTAVAVKEAGMLYKYATTVYVKKKSLTKILTYFLMGNNRNRALKRFNKKIEDDEVIQFCELGGLLLLLLQRIDKSKKLYTIMYKMQIVRFNRALFNFIKKHPVDAIIIYDVLSADFIKRIRNSNIKIKIFMDMSAPYYNFMEKEFIEDSEKHPEHAGDMIKTLNSGLYSYRRDYSRYEIENVDAFFVASDYTYKSLQYGGINQHVYKCEYGIDDFIDFTDLKKEVNITNESETIKILYVGNVNQQKGAYQILRIINKINSLSSFSFDFYGNVNLSNPYIGLFKNKCNFHGHIPRENMKDVYKNSDLLIFPTLSDGYGFVIPEALANGVPVIASKNAGSSQLIENGINGYLFNAGDDDQLIEILDMINNNRNLISIMKKNTKNSVNKLRWKRYNYLIKKALESEFNDS